MTTQLGVAYYGNRFINHAKEDLKRIAGCCDYVVHAFSESDLTFSKAVMAKVFNETRKLGLEIWVDPWALGGVFGGESFSKFLLEHRDSWQIMSDGRIMPGACLNRPEFRSFVKEWVLTVRDIGGQVIFWDEPHVFFDFESEWGGIYSCICPVCQDAFKRIHGVNLPPKLNDLARQFRRDTIKNFLVEMMAFAKSKGMKNALCLYAYKGIPEYDQLWAEAAALSDLDIFGCDPYWRWTHGRKDAAYHVGDFSKHVVASAKRNGKASQVWIQAMRLPAGAEPEIEQACLAAVDAGITHLAAWSYDGGELLDTILSERPGEVWRVLEQTYLKIRARQ
jgi:hypothetical protein